MISFPDCRAALQFAMTGAGRGCKAILVIASEAKQSRKNNIVIARAKPEAIQELQ
jgi:hypothetical protein